MTPPTPRTNPFDLTGLAPGDVVAVATQSLLTREAIEISEALQGQTPLDNHVVIVHHETGGVLWGVEGKPGGVGWVDMRSYIRDRHSVSNTAQPKTDTQRAAVAAAATAMLGTPYDWAAIADDGLAALHLPDLFTDDWDGHGAPGHVVCSSLAAYLYQAAGLTHPAVHPERLCTPGDWTEFSLLGRW